MKKIFKTLSKITNLICQLILIAGFFWLLTNGLSLPQFASMNAPMSMDEEMSESAPAARMMKSAPGGGGIMASAQAAEPAIKAKIIKTGRLSFTVKELQEAKKEIVQVLPEFKAYTLNEEEGKDIDNFHVSMTIKVPAERFDELVKKVTSLGFILENKSVQLSDVTEQYIDLEARLNNKKKLIEKYNSLLAQSQKVADTIEIHRQLESAGSELESLTGQMKYLNNQIDLSTLDLYLMQRLAPTEQSKESFFSEGGTKLNAGLSYLRNTLLFLLSMWPFILLGLAAAYLFRKFKKH